MEKKNLDAIYDKYLQEQEQQNELNSLKIKLDRDICFCGGKIPEEKVDEIEDTGICPICGKKMKSNIDDKIQEIQQNLVNLKRQKTLVSSNA